MTMQLPDVVTLIQNARTFKDGFDAFLQLQGQILAELQSIRDSLQPIPRSEPLPLDFDIPVGTAINQGYDSQVNISITRLLLACDTDTTVSVMIGESFTWLRNYPIGAFDPFMLDISGEMARTLQRGVKIRVIYAAGTGVAHAWARTS